ncbi:hypothetical protein [Tateyamaria sp. SN6-1]|uniref:hypothetical protein n=1 Tax=Tateyamaria sp. SN6-1 TaxID=3092148 RepID=UPI0039F49A41
MTEFVASLSWFGWALILLALCTLWQLPTILCTLFRSDIPGEEPQPGADPPHLNPAAQFGRPDDTGVDR